MHITSLWGSDRACVGLTEAAAIGHSNGGKVSSVWIHSNTGEAESHG